MKWSAFVSPPLAEKRNIKSVNLQFSNGSGSYVGAMMLHRHMQGNVKEDGR